MALIILNNDMKIVKSRHIVFKLCIGTQLDRLGYQQKQTIKIIIMTLVRLKPGREFLRDSMIPQNMMRAIDDMFNESLGKFERSVHFSPRTDVVEKDDRFELHINLPGTKKEDVKIEVDADVLTISGERKFVKEADDKYHTVESFYGSFSRSFTLPENADKEKIEASMNDGILKVDIFKSEVKQTKTSVVIK
jgi:HSP20 family protein